MDVESWKAVGQALGSIIIAVGGSGFLARWRLRKQGANLPPDDLDKEAAALRAEYLNEIKRLRRLLRNAEEEADECRERVKESNDRIWELERLNAELALNQKL